jgi:membrane protein DedA with SNARE-associated domain
MHELLSSSIQVIVTFVSQIGYLGIFIGMFLESTLVPLPSELIMIPAGLAASKGVMNIYLVTIAGITGNVLGAVFSYYLAMKIGHPLLLKIGKYFFVKEKTIIAIEDYFANHGPISVFLGRLLPGFRHFISLPAGLARMDIKLFFLYTTLGSTIWTSILSALGFFIGENQELIEENLHELIIAAVIGCVAIVVIYFWYKKRKR